MNILLVNDDGFDAPGLKGLKTVLEKYGNVYVVAPITTRSGAGAGLTSFKPMPYVKVDEKNYKLDGTPVDCVQLSTVLFNTDFDLIVSGCNNGFNISNDTMYSGTCGGCYQALIFEKKAIAFSSDKYPKTLKIAPKKVIDMCEKAFKYILENDLLSTSYYLNVNLPTINYEKDNGIKLTKLYRRHSTYKINESESSESMIRINYTHDDITNDDSYDVSAVQNGYISITPLRLINYSDDDYIDLVNKAKK